MAAKKLHDDVMVKAVKQLKEKQGAKERKNLFLSKEPYERLQDYCKEQGLSVSEVVDAWICSFVEREVR